MYLQPPLSLKQRLCNRTGARAFDDYQDYKRGGAQAVRGFIINLQLLMIFDFTAKVTQKQNMCLLAHTQT